MRGRWRILRENRETEGKWGKESKVCEGKMGKGRR